MLEAYVTVDRRCHLEAYLTMRYLILKPSWESGSIILVTIEAPEVGSLPRGWNVACFWVIYYNPGTDSYLKEQLRWSIFVVALVFLARAVHGIGTRWMYLAPLPVHLTEGVAGSRVYIDMCIGQD